jgi:hypothetical protein
MCNMDKTLRIITASSPASPRTDCLSAGCSVTGDETYGGPVSAPSSSQATGSELPTGSLMTG